MKHAAYLLALTVVVQLCGGCATIVTGAGEDQAVRFASTPRGANVFVDDQPVGQTPISVRLTRKDDHHVRIEHPGYKPYEKTIESGFNTWMVGNVVLGGLIGLGVDLLSGTNPALKTNNISARMIKDDTAYVAAPGSTAGYTTTGPPGAVRSTAYLNTAAPAPTYASPPPAAAPAFMPPPSPPPQQYRPAPVAPPAYQPAAHQAPPPPPAQRPAAPAVAPAPQQPAGTYKGW